MSGKERHIKVRVMNDVRRTVEMALLGSMMIESNVIGDVLSIIGRSESRQFSLPVHRILFEALVDLYCDGTPIDLVIVMDRLDRDGVLEQIGGTAYLVKLSESVPSAVNVMHYARIVRG